jgi:hypothetical protein
MSDHSLARTNRARRVTVTAHSALPIWGLASSNAPCKFGLERESHGREYSPGAGIPHGMAMAGQRRWTATMHARQYSQNGTDRLEIADVDGDGFDAKNATPRPTLLTTCISQKLSSSGDLLPRRTRRRWHTQHCATRPIRMRAATRLGCSRDRNAFN